MTDIFQHIESGVERAIKSMPKLIGSLDLRNAAVVVLERELFEATQRHAALCAVNDDRKRLRVEEETYIACQKENCNRIALELQTALQILSETNEVSTEFVMSVPDPAPALAAWARHRTT